MKWKAIPWGQTICITTDTNQSVWINPRGDSSKGIPSKEDKELARRIIAAITEVEGY